jgi:hypothetical protein
VPEFLIHHRHEPSECAAVYASFQGFVTPLRHRLAAASCDHGGHDIWWFVEAETSARATDLVPAYVARRSAVARIERVRIP